MSARAVGGPWKRRRRRQLAAGGALALAVIVTLSLYLAGPRGSHSDSSGEMPLGYLREPLGGRAQRVAAWTLGDARSLRAALAAQAIDEVDFDWYCSQADGSVLACGERLDQVSLARRAGVNVFATVTNRAGAQRPFERRLVVAILSSPLRRARHVKALVRLCLEKGFDGIDLDWEELTGEERDGFSLFVEHLATALHRERRFLSVAVYPKTFEPGRWAGQRAADYRRLGAAADEVKIMTYGASGGWSDSGPQATFAWVDRVLSFAETVIDPGKIAMGVPFFGFDWSADGAVRAITAEQGAHLNRAHHTAVGFSRWRDEASGEVVVRYVHAGEAHVAYFPDARTLAARLRHLRSRHPEVGGIAVWVMGQEASGFWSTVRRHLQP